MDEFERGRHPLDGVRHLDEAVEAVVGNGGDADRGVVFGRRVEAGQRRKQSVRAGAGEPDDPQVLHDRSGYRRPSTNFRPHMSKKTKKRKLRARRNKANHGKRPRARR